MSRNPTESGEKKVVKRFEHEFEFLGPGKAKIFNEVSDAANI